MPYLFQELHLEGSHEVRRMEICDLLLKGTYQQSLLLLVLLVLSSSSPFPSLPSLSLSSGVPGSPVSLPPSVPLRPQLTTLFSFIQISHWKAHKPHCQARASLAANERKFTGSCTYSGSFSNPFHLAYPPLFVADTSSFWGDENRTPSLHLSPSSSSLQRCHAGLESVEEGSEETSREFLF